MSVSNSENSRHFGGLLLNHRILSETRTLNGNIVLTTDSASIQYLNPNGANRTVDLPDSSSYRFFTIHNTGDSGEVITVRNSLEVTVAIVTQGQFLTLQRSGNAWQFNNESAGAAVIRPKFALLGDSISEFSSGQRLPPLSSPISIWRNDGYATWLRILSGQRINLPLENNFGVSGDRLDQILARVNSVFNSNAGYCIVQGGTNDITQSTAFATMVANWKAIISRLRTRGIVPICVPIPPRGDALTATQILTQLRFNNYIQEYCYANGLIFVQWDKYLLDQASATSAPISGMMRSDNIHPAISGGYYMGKALSETLSALLPPLQTHMVYGPHDYWHTTDNPTGNLLYSGTTSRGTLAGTGGTQTASTGLTYAGSGFAAGWTAVRGTATSTCTETLNKENPRVDDGRSSGERQIVQIAAAADGGADEIYNIRFSPNLADVAAGDYIYGEAAIEVTAAPTRCRSLEFYLFENRPSDAQTSIDNGSQDSLSGFLPAVTWSGILRTPPIQRQSDTTAIQANIRARMNASGGTAGITFKIGDMAVRKLAV